MHPSLLLIATFITLFQIPTSLSSDNVLEIIHTTTSGMKLGCTTLNGEVQELFFVTHNERVILDQKNLGARLPTFLPQECLQANNLVRRRNQLFPPWGRCRRGPRGAEGPKGARGVAGPKGKLGKDGTDGLNGRDGRDGLPGLKGPDGERGLQGSDGPQGLQGPPGLTGLPGPPGRDGRDELSASEPIFPNCEQFDVERVQRDATVSSTVNIFVCNAQGVDVDVAVNGSASTNEGLGYKVIKKPNGSEKKPARF